MSSIRCCWYACRSASGGGASSKRSRAWDWPARAGHRPDLLSGGERQRVAVARAIVRRPALVLADEPTANLDTATARQLIGLMHDLNGRLGITFLFSTHDQRLLDRASRIVRLCDGRVIEDTANPEVSDAQVSVARI